MARLRDNLLVGADRGASLWYRLQRQATKRGWISSMTLCGLAVEPSRWKWASEAVVSGSFAMGRLSDRTGVAPATIRHYLSLGLLPKPQAAASNRYLYDDRHVEGIRIIRALRRGRKLPLEMIKLVLADLMRDVEGRPVSPDMYERVVSAKLRKLAHPSPAVRLLRVATEGFNRLGYAEVTVDELCAAAGLAKGSFYRYYPSKEALFFAVVESMGERLARDFAHEVAEGPQPVTEERAAVGLRSVLRPILPLALELVARMAQGRPGYEEVGQQVLTRLADSIGSHGVSGRRVVELALGGSVRPLIGDPSSQA